MGYERILEGTTVDYKGAIGEYNGPWGTIRGSMADHTRPGKTKLDHIIDHTVPLGGHMVR